MRLLTGIWILVAIIWINVNSHTITKLQAELKECQGEQTEGEQHA